MARITKVLGRSPRPWVITLVIVIAVGLVGVVIVGDQRAARHEPPPGVGGSASGTPWPTASPPEAWPADGRSVPAPDPVYPEYGNPNIDVQRYDLTLAWSPVSRTLTATARLTVRIVRSVGEIALDFSEGYQIGEIKLDGAPAASSRRGGDLVIAAPGPVRPETVVTVVIGYRGTPVAAPFPGRRADVPAVGAMIGEGGELWATQQPYGAFTWFPCSDQPSDKALFDVTITAPPGWTGVSSGELVATTTGADGSTTTAWRGGAPSATYLLAFAVDRFERHGETGPHGLPVSYWVRREQSARMLPVLRRAPKMIDWLERRFGRYPFETLGIVVVPDRSAMETQTMISMGTLTGYRGETVLVHELAHQWFGDAVTPSTWKDLWLSEGFATYAEMLYAVDRLGADRADTLRSWREADSRSRKSAGPPGRYDPAHFAESNVYYGPALLLDALRRRIGSERLMAMLRDWALHHRHRGVDRAAFERWLGEYTGVDHSRLIETWLDSTTTPR